MISDQLRGEVQDWIKNDPDTGTAEQLSKWLSEGNELELNRCFNGLIKKIKPTKELEHVQ